MTVFELVEYLTGIEGFRPVIVEAGGDGAVHSGSLEGVYVRVDGSLVLSSEAQWGLAGS